MICDYGILYKSWHFLILWKFRSLKQTFAHFQYSTSFYNHECWICFINLYIINISFSFLLTTAVLGLSNIISYTYIVIQLQSHLCLFCCYKNKEKSSSYNRIKENNSSNRTPWKLHSWALQQQKKNQLEKSSSSIDPLFNPRYTFAMNYSSLFSSKDIQKDNFKKLSKNHSQWSKNIRLRK